MVDTQEIRRAGLVILIFGSLGYSTTRYMSELLPLIRNEGLIYALTFGNTVIPLQELDILGGSILFLVFMVILFYTES